MSYYLTKSISLELTGHQLHDAIKQAISQLYPIGLSRDTDEYKQHPKILRLMEFFEKNATDNKRFNQPWKDFLKKLRTGAKKRIHNSSLFTNSCFSGELILERYEDTALRRIKKIVFSVSYITNFFTIYGVDETFIMDKEIPWASGYHSINVITESPYSEFEKSFNYLQTAIVAQYPDYKFVPIRASLHSIKGLQVPYSNSDECSIHAALFDTSFELQFIRCFRGEIYYGSGPSNVSVALLPPPPNKLN